MFQSTPPDGMTVQWNTTPDGLSYERDAREQVVAPVMTSIMGLLAVFGNILTVLTIIRNKKLQTKSNVHIMNLAVADSLTGCVVFSYTIFLVSTSYMLQPKK